MHFIMDQLDAAAMMSPIVYMLVLLGGVASALSPCFVPVLAMFGGYVSGYAKDTAKQPLGMAAAFIAGQALTLAGVGVSAVLVGKSVLAIFTGYELDRYIPAAIGILVGLHLLGLFKFQFPLIGHLKTRRPDNLWASFTLGLPFGLVVTPCTIPIFVTIVAYLALNANALHGALVMIAYAFGRGIILGIVAYSAGAIKEMVVKQVRMAKVGRYVERLSGGIILAASLYLLFFYSSSSFSLPGT